MVPSKVFRARPLACLLASAAALLFAQSANAGVKSGDTFTFSIAGFNSSGTEGYILGTALSTVFGETTTFAAAGENGQAYTVSSWEVVGATSTTDYFKISTPVSFLTTARVNGALITWLQLDIGGANSGEGIPTGANPVNFSSPIGSYTASASITYGNSNAVISYTPTTNLSADRLSFTMSEGIAGSNPIFNARVHEFAYSITYANPVVAVPEPETYAMLLLGLGLVGAVARRRQTRA
ncbi:PEPxxWA-CTERM sorting domain-containing protein [Pseudoduganella sp. FT26W]|uniref:PEPxxWA-CTERM sorting domain-containing protein n=1 Tax=Duganella aquatilis TaxID=2666082 RepID=A0A844CVY6_9BURK|nr:FxDxF family PEP-CTERM protein [Duganella aquatilis]MRW82941.1 PEPxxWA-CTERM sorting domain-containing protein [Duganella aquatilis]